METIYKNRYWYIVEAEDHSVSNPHLIISPISNCSTFLELPLLAMRSLRSILDRYHGYEITFTNTSERIEIHATKTKSL